MDAEVVEVIGGAGLDHRIEKTHVEIGDAHADLDGGVDLLDGVVRFHYQVGVVLHPVRPLPSFVEAAVELVPNLPVLDVLLVARHRGADVIAPVLHVLDRALARPAVGRRPGGEVTPATRQMEVVAAVAAKVEVLRVQSAERLLAVDKGLDDPGLGLGLVELADGAPFPAVHAVFDAAGRVASDAPLAPARGEPEGADRLVEMELEDQAPAGIAVGGLYQGAPRPGFRAGIGQVHAGGLKVHPLAPIGQPDVRLVGSCLELLLGAVGVTGLLHVVPAALDGFAKLDFQRLAGVRRKGPGADCGQAQGEPEEARLSHGARWCRSHLCTSGFPA